MWIRACYFTIDFQCCYTGNFMLKKRAIYENVRVLERNIEKPIEDLMTWADRISRDTAEEAARIACEELSVFFYGCDINVTNLRYTETLMPPVKIPKPPPPPPIVPKYILEEIEYLETLYREAETVDEKMAIREEINGLKERYGLT